MSIRTSLVLILLAVGCGGSSSKAPDAFVGEDLGAGQSCFAIAECAFQCTAGDGTCIDACVTMGSSAAQQAYAALTTCGYQLCTEGGADGGTHDGGSGVHVDGGLTTCAGETDQTAACIQCVQDAMQTPTCASFATSCSNQ